MKKLIYIYLLIVFFTTWSCTKNENVKIISFDLHAQRTAYLNNLYEDSYEIVREKSFVVAGQRMLLTEVKIKETELKAYTIENFDNFDLLYFFTYNELTNELEVYDLNNDEIDIFQWGEIEVVKNKQRQGDFDPFDLVKNNSENQTANRVAFGWECDPPAWDYDRQQYYMRCCKYFLWVRVKCETVYW